jgi:CRISPR-associated DxTHG motif protein
MAEEWPPEQSGLPAHVTTPLLTRITEGSLDADYREVAQRRAVHSPPAAGARQPVPAQLTAAIVVAVFGVLVTVAAVQTSRNAEITDASRATLVARVQAERETVAGQQARIAELQDGNIRLEGGLDAVTVDQQAQLSRQRRLEVRTGYVQVRGPGVRITVDDAPNGDETQLVYARDLAMLVNGLWRAGAEAIAVNGQRLTPLSAIRNAGLAVEVNNRPVNPPYAVQAIGDPGTLQANLLDTTHGLRFFDLAADLGFVVTRQNEEELTLPAARGPRLQYVRRGTSGPPGMEKGDGAP